MSNQSNAASPLDIMAAETPKRALHFYKIPEALRPIAKGITRIGVAELGILQEQHAAERSRGNPMRLAIELTIESLAVIEKGEKGGKRERLSMADGSAEAAYSAMNPKIRNLVATAYAEVHGTKQEVVEDFLASHAVETL